MILEAASITELSIAVVGVLGAWGMCMRQSRCDSIETPCIKIHRVVPPTEKPPDVEMTPVAMPEPPARPALAPAPPPPSDLRVIEA